MKRKTPELATNLLNRNINPYITIGLLLRKLSIDELPQLVNIYKGDMNFFGPRPALYNQYKLIELRSKHGISSIKPGVTGWAQINGRDSLSDEQKTRLDKFYLRNRSCSLNFKILILTLIKTLRGEDINI